MCISCGFTFEGDEIVEHKRSNDCPGEKFVLVKP